MSEFDIQYRPRTAIKGQVVVDFIAEFTLVEGQGQKRSHNGAFTQTNPLIGKQVEVVWYSTAQKEIRLNAWFVWTSLQPITK